jgi:glycosyltransferase involved in cell wall biosynthesis
MRIAYVTTYDARDPSIWAGTGHYIAKALEAQGIELDYIGPLHEPRALWLKGQQLLYRKALGQELHRDREPAVGSMATPGRSRRSSRQLPRNPDRLLAGHGPDRASEHEAAHRHVVLMRRTGRCSTFYVWNYRASQRSQRNGDAQERAAIARSSLSLFSSDWAARSAIELYGADPAKVKVIPFGANIPSAQQRKLEQVTHMIDARPRGDRCRLLFVGIGWERKGGDVAVEVARLLNERGLPTEVTMLGSNPPDPSALPSFVKAIGFVDKKTEAGREQFDQIFGSSHFLLLPARAEAFGVVLCEANSYGVPNLATRVGGIPTIVRDGKNGVLFPPDDAPSMADVVLDLMRDYGRYRELAFSSFEEYQSRLNWDVIGRHVKALLEGLVRH